MTRARSAPWARPTASTSSAPTAWAWPTPGTGCGSAARSAATIPARRCCKGSVAIFSNSGNFTTTIANYLAHRRLGHHDLDLQRQGRLHPLRRARVYPRARQRRAQQGGGDVCRARRLLRARRWNSKKPIVACVVGRWKAKLTRAVGHAGAMAGLRRRRGLEGKLVHGDVRRRRGVLARDPICSAKGAVVTNIAHIPQALTKVMALNGDRARLRAQGRPLAQGLARQQSGSGPAGRARPAGDRGARTLRCPDPRDPAPGGCRLRPPVDEGYLGRHADGPGLAGHQPARRLDARRRAATRSNPICASPSCASVTAPTTTLWPTSRSPPTSISTAIRCSPPPTLPGKPATRRTRCSRPPPAFSARAGSAAFRAADRDAARPVPGQGPGRQRRGDAVSIGIERRAVPCWAPRRIAGPRPCWRRSRRSGAKSVFVRYLRGLGEPRHCRCGARRDRADPGLGSAAAQAHQPAHRRSTCPGTWRSTARLIGAAVPGHRHEADRLLRCPGRGDPARLERHRARRPGAHRAPPRPGRAAALSGPARPPALQRARHDLGPGCQGCGLRRWPGDPGAGAAQQGHGRAC